MTPEPADGGRLMVIVPDRLSDLVAKGEVTERYYNPGDVFDEVHLVMVNDDHPDHDALRVTTGRARLVLHNLPPRRGVLRRTLGYRPLLLRSWAAEGVELARHIRPRLVRCHGAWLNAFVAYEIRRRLGIPYVVSLHINPDEDVRGRAGGRERLEAEAIRSVERVALRGADLVLPVYRPIVPYLDRLGVERYELAYNMLNPSHLRVKEDYSLHRPVRVVSVGRQFAAKNPERLIGAVARLPAVELTVVGDGPGHEHLRRAAEREGVGGRVVFERAIANEELCHRLPEFDVFATHTEYWELSKSLLEALVTGLPVVVNRRRGEPVPELTPDIAMLVEDTVDAYRDALERLILDDDARERLGRAARARSLELWAPERSEARLAEIYRRLASSPASAPARYGS
jgi:glycosyltransferase involved in cell wall biosynthesis